MNTAVKGLRSLVVSTLIFSFSILSSATQLTPASSAAQASQATLTPPSLLTAYQSRWSVEGSIQAQSVSGPGSPWAGVAASYRIFNPLSFGLRGFVPLSKTVDESTYAIQSYLRLRTVHGTYTDLFFEPSFAENFYNMIPFSSFGLSMGVLTRVGSGISVGVVGGIEMAKVVVDSIGLENEDSYAVYPKVALIGDFNF